MMRSTIFSSAFCLLALSASAGFAAPGDPIGQAIAIKNDVTAAYEKDRRKLSKDDPVRQEEVIEVGEDSLGELRFKDDTKLALGPGSRMTLDKFVYDPEKTNGSIVVNLLKGTFRFITGIAAKPSYLIKTPSASISVRGTIFDVYIQAGGEVWLLLIEGAIEVCTSDGDCRVLDEPGKFIRVTGTRKAGGQPDTPRRWNIDAPVKWTGLPGHKTVRLESAFPFVPAAPSFDRDPWYTANDIIIGRFPRHPRHPHHPDKPPRDNNGGKDGGKDGGGNTGGTGTRPPTGDKPPVIVKDKPKIIIKVDKPDRPRPPRVHKDDPPKKVTVEEHVRKRPKRDGNNDTPVIRRKGPSEDKPPRRVQVVPPKVTVHKVPITKPSNLGGSKPTFFKQDNMGFKQGNIGGSFGHGRIPR